MRNIVLTGATGFVGRYLLKQLLEDGCFVTAVVRSEGKKIEILEFLGMDNFAKKDNLLFVETSLEEIDAKVFPEMEYDAWIHLAWGGVNREEINAEEVHNRNFNNSIKCLIKAKELKCGKFIETGSRAECGHSERVIPEEMIGEPLNVYGKYKRMFYEYAYDFCNKNGLTYLHLRLFAITGPGDHPWSLVSDCCRKFSTNEAMKFGSCEQTWNYLDVRDAAKIIVCLSDKYIISRKDNCIINIASDCSQPLKEYIYLIYNSANSSSELCFSDNKGFDSCPEIKKLKPYIKSLDTISFKETIKDMLVTV